MGTRKNCNLKLPPYHERQRPSHCGCNSRVSWAGSLSLVR